MSDSNVNSQGFPVDHDGECLEYSVLEGGAPIAISAAVFQEIFSGSGKEGFSEPSHTESEALGGTRVVHPSCSGGIPVVAEGTVEDYVSSDDEPLSPNSAIAHCNKNTSATVHAMMQVSKHERDDLVRTRTKLNQVLHFLKSQGFSEENVLAASGLEGSGCRIPSRDEFGLPPLKEPRDENIAQKVLDELPIRNAGNFSSTGPVESVNAPDLLKDKMKGKIEENAVATQIHVEGQLSGEKSERVEPKKSWSQVVNEHVSKSPPVEFDFIKIPAGTTTISPPVEILKQGNDKFKYCLVGSFSKGYLPYSKVADFARKTWEHKGLTHISQKDSRTFLFFFKDFSGINGVLARGTWFIDRRPLIVNPWGIKPCKKTSMPLWVKFENVPDSYWTREGLSWLASSIGKPLCADENTSRLEVLPFAKLCVDYSIGNSLPTCLDVEVLDPATEVISVEKVLVSYPSKPLICEGCKSLGHLVGACPKVTRQWVRKEQPVQPIHLPSDSISDPPSIFSEEKPVKDQNIDASDTPVVEVEDASDWQQVKRKSGTSGNSDSSKQATVPVAKAPVSSPALEISAPTASAMPIYNALSRTLSKNQRKKARRSGGKTPPFKH